MGDVKQPAAGKIWLELPVTAIVEFDNPTDVDAGDARIVGFKIQPTSETRQVGGYTPMEFYLDQPEEGEFAKGRIGLVRRQKPTSPAPVSGVEISEQGNS